MRRIPYGKWLRQIEAMQTEVGGLQEDVNAALREQLLDERQYEHLQERWSHLDYLWHQMQELDDVLEGARRHRY